MKIRYIAPLSRAIDRSIQICFRPFDLAKWFVLGFGCWLARLSQGGGGGFSIPTPPIGDREAEGAGGPPEWSEWASSIDSDMLFGGALLFVFLGCVALFVFVVLPVLIWLSSRGEFIFLDGVVQNRAEIKAPWSEYREQGNSLFLWRLGFIVAVVLGVILAAVPMILYITRVGEEMPAVPMALLLLSPILLVAFGAIYVDLFLRSFVVPIMYKHRLKTNAAWRFFAPVLKARIGWFLLYGPWLLLLMIAVGFALLILILVTCCIAGILLVIPYIGTVLLLPLYAALRALSLEFLAQFGEQFRLFPDPPPVLATAAAGAGEPPPPPAPPQDSGPPSATFEPEV